MLAPTRTGNYRIETIWVAADSVAQAKAFTSHFGSLLPGKKSSLTSLGSGIWRLLIRSAGAECADRAGQFIMTNSLASAHDDELYDLVIEGTGLTESILSAAAAWAGKKVIHIDKNNFYGSHWASLSIIDFDEWVQQHSANGSPTHRNCGTP